MALRKQLPYPPGLDRIAEQFGVSTPKLLEEIANGELVVIRASVGDDSEDNNEAILQSIERGWKEVMNGEVEPIETLWDNLDDD